MTALRPWHLLILLLLLLIAVVAAIIGLLVLGSRRFPRQEVHVSRTPVLTDPETGRLYIVDPATGQTLWVDRPPDT